MAVTWQTRSLERMPLSSKGKLRVTICKHVFVNGVSNGNISRVGTYSRNHAAGTITGHITGAWLTSRTSRPISLRLDRHSCSSHRLGDSLD